MSAAASSGKSNPGRPGESAGAACPDHRDERDPARQRGHGREGRVEVRAGDPQAVRSDEAHAGAAADLEQRCAPGLSLRAVLETAGDHEEAADAAAGRRLGDRDHGGSRYRHDGELDRSGNRVEAGVHGEPVELPAAGVDEVQWPGEARPQVCEQRGAHRVGSTRGTDERDGRRREEGAHRGHGGDPVAILEASARLWAERGRQGEGQLARMRPGPHREAARPETSRTCAGWRVGPSR